MFRHTKFARRLVRGRKSKREATKQVVTKAAKEKRGPKKNILLSSRQPP